MRFNKGDIVHWYSQPDYVAIVVSPPARSRKTGTTRMVIRWISIPVARVVSRDKREHSPANFVLMVKNNAA